MRDLYSEKDLQQLSSQLKKRYLLLGLVLLLLVLTVLLFGRTYSELERV